MPSTGLSLRDYVDYIKLQLGDPVIKLEVTDENIEKIIKMSFNTMRNYIMDIETMTLPFSNIIDLKDKKVASISYVMRGISTYGPGGLQDVMYLYSRFGAYGNYTLTDYAKILLANQNKNAIATDLDFYFDKRNDKLYLYCNQPLPTSITIAYSREYESVEEIIEPFWQDLLRRLSLANTKEVLGRIRGKYTLNSATYNLDSDKLLSEAQSEKAEIMEFLNANTDLLLPID